MVRRVMWMRLIAIGVLVFGLGGTTPANAQRDDFLVRMLTTSEHFRVRAQAALSLAATRPSTPVLNALGAALRDAHPSVRAASASALERLGDPSVLPGLRSASRDSDPTVRRAVQSAVRTLERVATTPRSVGANAVAGAGSGGTQVPVAGAQYYVGVGEPGGTNLDPQLVGQARQVVERLLRGVTGVEVAAAGEAPSQVNQTLRRRQLVGFFIDSSIASVEETGGNTRVRVSVILGTYPGRDMRAMLSGTATVPGATGAEARAQALEGAYRGAFRNLPQAMQSARR